MALNKLSGEQIEQATTTAAGVVQLATDADVTTGTDTTKPVTVKQLGDTNSAIAALDDEIHGWQKPADWIDIRSGALPNSVYFLVGHSADYSTYPTFTVLAGVSNSGTYDVFVDGIKQATTASATETTLNWQTLALTSGYDVTYPVALKTHVVRVTPTLSSDTLTSIRTDYSVVKGVMWAHITLAEIGLYRFLSVDSNVYQDRAPLFEALTTPTNEIKVTSFTAAFNCIKNIKTLPVFIGKGNSFANRVGTNYTFTRSGIKRLHFKDFFFGDPYGVFRGCTELESIELENSYLSSDSYIFENCYKLKRLPNPWKIGSLFQNAITNAAALEPTFLDVSQNTDSTRVDVRGSSTYFMKGLKGIIVSNAAPFNSTTSPQINVQYTGLDRAALVNLFKSMPYNVGYTVVGSPTIIDGVISGFSGDDYAETSLQFDASKSFKIHLDMNYTHNGSSQFFLSLPGETAGNLGFYFNGSGTGISTQSGSSNYWAAITGLTADGNLIFELEGNGTTLTVRVIKDGQTYTNTTSYSDRNFGANKHYARFGRRTFNQPFSSGSINFNNSYIESDGIMFFNGAAAMTKTCSIVGCTGTADLTADDKAIAEDKGWELVLS